MDSTQQSSAAAALVQRSPVRALDASAKPRTKLLAALRKPTAESSESEADSESGSSASEDESPVITTVSKPLTIPPPQVDADQANDGDESDGEDAYELMKKRLAASKTLSAVETAPQQAQQTTHVAATIESSDDEDEMPVRTKVRRPVAKTTKTASPQASPSPNARLRSTSPGLFVTPDPSPAKKKYRSSVDAGSDSETSQLSQNADLQERVRRIREERLAKQQEPEAQQTKPKKTTRRRNNDSGSDTDGESGRRLTQQAKPTRRAGKKAMEAMARDQQRISRNMQLTHQAKTKKRFTTQDLFKKFNFQAPNTDSAALPTPEPSSALASSDAEANQVQNPLPASPSRQNDNPEATLITSVEQTCALVSNTENDIHSPKPTKLDKGKGRATEFQHLPEHPWMKQTKTETAIQQDALADTKSTSNDAMVELSDSDDDQSQAQPKSRFPVFDRLPAKKDQEAGSLVRLRALAQLTKSPPKGKKGQKSVTRGEMEMLLAQKAREQTARAREERIADLIKRGHNPETEEEREKRQEEIDDMVALLEKQRQEDLQLAKREKNEAKQNGETIDELPSSDEEDGDYIGSGEENAGEDEDEDENQDEIELELSGSEDEEVEHDDDAKDSQTEDTGGLVEGMADEEEQGEANQPLPDDEDALMEDDDLNVPSRRRTVNRARNRVIDDDDDDDDDESDTGTNKNAPPTQAATQDDAMAAFGFGKVSTDVGLTQMFAGTMAELESESHPAVAETEQDSLDFLHGLPETQPNVNLSQASDFMVPNSQSLMSPEKTLQTGSESRLNLDISQVVKTSPDFSQTQPEDFEPTQDAGFSFSRSPAGLAPPPSTVDTVMMVVAESPIKQKKGKLQRGRREATVEFSDVEEDLVDHEEEEESEEDIQRPPKPSKDAFRRMQQAAKKARAAEEFDKKNSLAREAVMDQAEESEDEYAGLGGASDDEEGEEDEELKNMIDHNDVKVDERQIAAFYADKAKKDDEKQLAELYKKMQSKGGLRRHAGGYDGFDMSDSEDEAEMRQRKKRAAFQKQTNALLQDQKVKALADDAKKKAFFNTLADFADEGEYDYLNMPEKEMDVDSSQSQSQNQNDDVAIPDSQNFTASTAVPLKRKSESSQKENRPPPQMRRTAASDTLSRKPLTADDVKHSISELIEDPRVIIPDSQLSDAEEDDENIHTSEQSSRRKPIIDRLTLSRQSTLEESVVSAESNLAFHNPTRTAAGPGFRIPSLIRQATSNLSVSSERSTGSGAAASAPKEAGIRRGGTGRSNIHAQAREAERRQLLEKKEGKRKEALRKKVEGGRKKGMRSVLSDLGGGFE